MLLGMIAAQQSVYYLELAERRPANETFEYGWQLNRALGG
ncbi:putative peptidoglycan-binding domain-containing protein [Burkholderia sp. Nafp2/4-1b]|nr:putative peptidoglycan-binding domain-containing protein [Burkholderia sp. Nafp2/4-1b]